MKKGNVGVFLFLALALSLVVGSVAVSAQSPPLGPIGEAVSQFFNIDGGALLSWFILGLVVLLIYSALSSVEFPESSAIRWPLAIIVGLIATIFISSQEILAAVSSYTALGITLVLFFPLVVLMFFTFTVATKVNPFGIVLQRVAWIIYSVYLFVRSGIGLMTAYANRGGQGALNPLNKFLTAIAGEQSFIGKIYNFLGGSAAGASGDTVILLVLFVTSITVFFIFVVGNKKITEWFMEEKRGADISKFKDTGARAKAVEDARAEQTK